ncbi:MAG: tail fiber domain-containing protein [Actinomycetota bacterium]
MSSSLRSRARRLLHRSRPGSSTPDASEPTAVEFVDGAEILARLRALPISTWNYVWDPPTTRHLGPMAQDFRAAFGLGDDDTRIHAVDATGVSLVAIQALCRRIESLEARVAELEPPSPPAATPGSPR